MTWKYGLILIAKAQHEYEDDYCELVELYSDDDGKYTSFCTARTCTVDSLKLAAKDAEIDGINTYFYDNGTFEYNAMTNDWDWFPDEDDGKKIKRGRIAIDFDGVINSYKSGFVAIDVIPDPPVPGSFDFIKEMVDAGYSVSIYSTRGQSESGRLGIEKWLEKYSMSPELIKKLDIAKTKPIAKLYIDDRAWAFNGSFPTLRQVDNFLPWHGGKSSSEK